MKRTVALILMLAFLPPGLAMAQAKTIPVELILRPAPQPVPALKYRLVPEPRILIPGNAAVFYHRGILLLAQSSLGQARAPGAKPPDPENSPEMRISRWATGPIAQLPREEARKQLEAFQGPLKEAELAAMRQTCDWEFDRRKEGFDLLLPEIQELRSLARLIAVKARLAILDGKIDEAMHWIQVGMVMGRHAAEGPTLIQALVGVAIDSVMAICLTDLIQAPGTPSLFWALADRPRPFIDLRRPMEGELTLFNKALPELEELDRGPMSLTEVRRFVEQIQKKIYSLTGSALPPPGGMGQLGIAAMAVKVYPEARSGLIAAGRTETEVDAMPVVQVSVLYSIKEYVKRRDESYKWINVPYWQSYDRVDPRGDRTMEAKLSSPLLTLFDLLTPAINSARLATLRLERHLDAMQCIEAIRLDASLHGGKLPASLEAITEAPTPIDVISGKPFSYAVNGDTATLSAPVPPGGPNHPAYSINYLIKLAK
ncbi:hypothetical protein EP7_002773 [Isosphaeraceae bacterium EP7]